MVYNFLTIISVFFFILSILNPLHYPPVSTFISELLSFLSVIFLIPKIISISNKFLIPRTVLFIFPICFIPLFQYGFGQIFFSSTAILSSIYLFLFLFLFLIGFNLSKIGLRESSLIILSFTFIICGCLSSAISIVQWLNIPYENAFMMQFRGNRPYANLAQPNQLATFLWMSVFLCWYLFEKRNLNAYTAAALTLLFIFAIVLTQSRTGWIIAIFSMIFIQLKIKNCRLNRFFLSLFGIYNLICIIFLPFLNSFLEYYFNIIQTSNVVDRMSSGYLRFAIWNQMLHALIEQPLLGYGWYQTSVAQSVVIDRYVGQEWVTSAHNFIFDILVWCGIPIGLIIIGGIFLLYFRIFKLSFASLEQKIIFLIISAVGIHSCFEFPLFYAYFLFPIGFLCGLSLDDDNIVYKFSSKYLWIPFVLGMIFLWIIFKDYTKVNDNFLGAKLHALGEQRSNFEEPAPLFFFDNFSIRAKWFALYPKMIVSDKQLKEAKQMTQLYLTPYDIKKYAILLAYNHQVTEAKRQLKILEIMYGDKLRYSDLLDNHETIVSPKK